MRQFDYLPRRQWPVVYWLVVSNVQFDISLFCTCESPALQSSKLATTSTLTLRRSLTTAHMIYALHVTSPDYLHGVAHHPVMHPQSARHVWHILLSE